MGERKAMAHIPWREKQRLSYHFLVSYIRLSKAESMDFCSWNRAKKIVLFPAFGVRMLKGKLEMLLPVLANLPKRVGIEWVLLESGSYCRFSEEEWHKSKELTWLIKWFTEWIWGTKRLMARKKKKKTMKNTPGYRTSDLSSCWKCTHC